MIGNSYISLIQSMRYLIPLRRILLEVSCVFWIKFDSYNSYTTTFEYNEGEIESEMEPK